MNKRRDYEKKRKNGNFTLPFAYFEKCRSRAFTTIIRRELNNARGKFKGGMGVGDFFFSINLIYSAYKYILFGRK